jgi:hypothetical protein
MSHFKFGLIIATCILLYNIGVCAQDTDIQDRKGTVHGYITDTTPAQLPIAGVRIQIHNMKGHFFLTKSAETGEFIYRGMPAGDYVINFRKAGYQSRIGLPVSVTNGGSHYVPLTMNKKGNVLTGFRNIFNPQESQGGSLQLQIFTQSQQPIPIENADIKIKHVFTGTDGISNKKQIVDNKKKFTVTEISDAKGQFRRDNLPPGVYTVNVGKFGIHTLFSVIIRENRVTAISVALSVSNGILDTQTSSPQKINTKWIIRGRITETNFQETPIKGVYVGVTGSNLSGTKDSFESVSNADGEYELILPAGHYGVFLMKEGYQTIVNFFEIAADSRQSNVTVIEEGMFVVYEAIAKRNVFELKNSLRKEKTTFSTIISDLSRIELGFWLIGILSIMGIITFISRLFSKYKLKYIQE